VRKEEFANVLVLSFFFNRPGLPILPFIPYLDRTPKRVRLEGFTFANVLVLFLPFQLPWSAHLPHTLP
jgi:hypothetical protein